MPTPQEARPGWQVSSKEKTHIYHSPKNSRHRLKIEIGSLIFSTRVKFDFLPYHLFFKNFSFPGKTLRNERSAFFDFATTPSTHPAAAAAYCYRLSTPPQLVKREPSDGKLKKSKHCAIFSSFFFFFTGNAPQNWLPNCSVGKFPHSPRYTHWIIWNQNCRII